MSVHDFIEFSTEPISFMDTPIVQSARENSEALITCMVKGDPEPSVSWYYNGQLLNGMYLNHNCTNIELDIKLIEMLDMQNGMREDN